MPAAHAAFVLLVLLNAVRIYRHAMWRDETQAFAIALHSTGLLDLFHNLRYEGHPGLWHALLWCLTRFTADPRAMQALEFAIGLGVWLLIYRRSPFGTGEKFALLLGYYLFFEYFVLSRGYALMALLGFAFVVLRRERPQAFTSAWLLLGMLANTELFGAIWSMAFAPFLAVAQRSNRGALVRGIALYLSLFALAVATMMPAADSVPPYRWNIEPHTGFSFAQLASLVAAVTKALLPLDSGWLFPPKAAGGVSGPAFFNPDPLSALKSRPDVVGPVLLGMAVIAAGTWFAARGRRLALPPRIDGAPILASLGLGWIGVLSFLYIFQIPLGTRYAGILFLMLVAAAWQFRYDRPGRAPRWWMALLVLNALGGLCTLRSEFIPFSDSRAAADWLVRNHLNRAFLIADPDSMAQPVGVYLGRALYGVECECDYTFMSWNVARQPLDAAAVLRRAERGMARARTPDAILIRSGVLPKRSLADAAKADLSLTLLERLPAAEVSDERYSIYRIAAAHRDGHAPPP
ncbi:MAG TPA: hypothetical protein VMU87_05630 [Stellaceae bacterium]|nr:hypothetical protein [Stellaceae bacterium]